MKALLFAILCTLGDGLVKGCFCQPIGWCIDAGLSGNFFVNERNYKIRIKEPFILSPDNAPDTLQYGRNSNASGSSMPDAFLVRYADPYEKNKKHLYALRIVYSPSPDFS